MMIKLIAVLALFLADAVADDLKAAREELLRRTEEYRKQLVDLISIEDAARLRAGQAVSTRRSLYDQGLVSRRELEESQARLQDAVRRIEDLNRQLRDSDEVISEVRLAIQEVQPEQDGSLVIRFAGNSQWTLEKVPDIRRFYTTRFGQQLPVSAFGQTALHNRFGLAHHNAIDVALHPDSPEGQALLEYLREARAPFIAFRTAVPGSATGAHIHIGPPSLRVQVSAELKSFSSRGAGTR